MAVNKSVLVHSCRLQPRSLTRDLVVSGDLYVGELGINLAQQEGYRALPKSCRCKRYVTVAQATEFEAQGWAAWIVQFKRKKGEVVLNTDVSMKLYMPVLRERVPRVDLISRADIERAYIGSEKISAHYKYNPTTQRYTVVRIFPEGSSAKEWMAEADVEVRFERRIRKQFKRYIEECHNITMSFRQQLIVPFKPDPFEGRPLIMLHEYDATNDGRKPAPGVAELYETGLSLYDIFNGNRPKDLK
ncbi:MAG: hypothetical protein OK457_00195 [Thaumarchaeota archaeon]|nr:hypothetical protein [Nitrososphaerota archaeon]